jgi:hypothetical protein
LLNQNIGMENRTQSRRFSQWMFVTLPIVLVMGSITPPQIENWFPATIFFEVAFFAAVGLSTLFLPPRKYLWLWAGILLVLALRFTTSLSSDYPAPIDEFFRAHKWVIYCLVLISALKIRVIEARKLNFLVNLILIASAVKYIYSAALLGIASRPGIFAENNYELFLLFGLVIVVYELGFRKNLLFFSTLGLVVFLSGSRSGAIGFLVVVLYLVSKAQNRTQFIQYLVTTSVALAAGVSLFIFQNRGTNFENLDRINFFSRFLVEVRDWDWVNWVFGAQPLTQMTTETCLSLSFYSVLLSSAQDGSCYSVILHSQILRLILDFGLIGLVLCFYFLYFILRSSGVNVVPASALVLLALSNSFSVSGPNNVYVVFPILAAIITHRPSEPFELAEGIQSKLRAR